jgi:hypothetical protein
MGVEYRHFVMPLDRAFQPAFGRIATLVERLRAERWVLTPEHPAFEGQFNKPAEVRACERTGGRAERFGPNPSRSRRMRWETALPVPIPIDEAWLSALRDPGAADPQADELALIFPVNLPDGDWDDLDVRYPFTFGEDEPGYHDVIVLASRDFIHHSSENIDPVETACARCGADLGYEPDDRLFVVAADFHARIRARCPGCGAPFHPSAQRVEIRDGYTTSHAGLLAGGAAFRFAVVVDCSKGWPRGKGAPALHADLLRLCEETIGARCVSAGDFY